MRITYSIPECQRNRAEDINCHISRLFKEVQGPTARLYSLVNAQSRHYLLGDTFQLVSALQTSQRRSSRCMCIVVLTEPHSQTQVENIGHKKVKVGRNGVKPLQQVEKTDFPLGGSAGDNFLP